MGQLLHMAMWNINFFFNYMWIIGQCFDRRHLSIKASQSVLGYCGRPVRLERGVFHVLNPFPGSAPCRWQRGALNHSSESRLMPSLLDQNFSLGMGLHLEQFSQDHSSEGTSRGVPVQRSAQVGPPGAGGTRTPPGGFGMSPQRDTPALPGRLFQGSATLMESSSSC